MVIVAVEQIKVQTQAITWPYHSLERPLAAQYSSWELETMQEYDTPQKGETRFPPPLPVRSASWHLLPGLVVGILLMLMLLILT